MLEKETAGKIKKVFMEDNKINFTFAMPLKGFHAIEICTRVFGQKHAGFLSIRAKREN